MTALGILLVNLPETSWQDDTVSWACFFQMRNFSWLSLYCSVRCPSSFCKTFTDRRHTDSYFLNKFVTESVKSFNWALAWYCRHKEFKWSFVCSMFSRWVNNSILTSLHFPIFSTRSVFSIVFRVFSFDPSHASSSSMYLMRRSRSAWKFSSRLSAFSWAWETFEIFLVISWVNSASRLRLFGMGKCYFENSTFIN